MVVINVVRVMSDLFLNPRPEYEQDSTAAPVGRYYNNLLRYKNVRWNAKRFRAVFDENVYGKIRRVSKETPRCNSSGS